MIEITIPLNTSRESKNKFMAEWLIPYLSKSPSRYFVIRKVIQLPVFVVYVDHPAEGLDLIQSEMTGLVASFIDQVEEADRKPAAHYEDLWDDIRKIHQYKHVDQLAQGLISSRVISHITRTGHYYRAEDIEIFNYFGFRAQPLVERSLAYLQGQRQRREIPFAYSLFVATSCLFESGKGYLSFKSHVLGFFSFRHPVLPKYLEAFRSDYEHSRDALSALRLEAEAIALSADTTATLLAREDPLLQLVSEWSVLLLELRNALYAVRDKPQKSLFRSAKAQMDYLQFRRLSEFHRKAFSRKGQQTISSREFGAFRMCVNFVYLLLPTLGISSRKRVEAAYLFVRSAEHPHDFLSNPKSA